MTRPARSGELTKLWTASTASGAGDGLVLVAAPLLAATLTSDPRLIAGVTTALTLPYLLFGLPAGVLIDRVDRRRGMVAVDGLRAVLVGVFTVLAATHHVGLPTLYGCMFLIGTCETFFRDAQQAIVPRVAGGRLLHANGLLATSEILTKQFVGPLLGGVLFTLGVAIPFGLDAASFALSCALLAWVRLSPRPPASTTARTRPTTLLTGLGHDLVEGIGWLLRHRVLRRLAVVAGVSNLVNWAALALLVIYAHDQLHLARAGYGVLLVGSAAGGLLASRLGPRLAGRTGSGWAMCLALGAQTVALVMMATAWEPVLAVAGLVVSGGGVILWNVVSVALRQTLVPDHLLGRVSSIYRLVAWGSVPVGSALGGLFAHAVGLRWVFVVGAALLLAVTVSLARLARSDALEHARATTAGSAGPPPVGADTPPVPATRPAPSHATTVEQDPPEAVGRKDRTDEQS